MWPFRRKDAAPYERKSATFFFALGAGKAGLTGAEYDRIAAEGYAQCVVAFACINRIASAVASVDLQLYRRGKAGKLDKVESHELLTRLERPNAAQSGREFIKYLISYHQLAGNAYVYGNGIDPMQRKPQPPTELQLLDPGKVQIARGDSFLPRAYEYRPNATKQVDYPVDQVTGRSAVMHLKSFNPLNGWYGMSGISAAALAIDIHNSGSQWNKRLIENGARPSGAMVVRAADGKPAELSEAQYNRVREMIDEMFSGPSNTGRPLLLEGGLEWQEMSLNPKDMDFLEGKNSAARDIALAFGVPPQLIGIKGDSTFANYEQATLSFWTETVIPLLCWTLEGFNRWLTPLYGDDLYLWYDEEQIAALEPLRKAKAERINAAKYMKINEKRRAMGLDDIEGGETVFVSSSEIPLELAGVMPDLAEPGSEADPDEEEDEA